MTRGVSFEIGHKSILYLFLAFAFNGKAVSNAYFKELGCKFVNDEYLTEPNPYSTAPIWSEEVMESMELPFEPKDSYWQPFVDYLSEVSVMNDVSPFTKFVKTYKTNHNGSETLSSFYSFFDNYDIPFQLNETRDPASYIIQMFHKLKDNHQNQPEKPVLKYYYLVSGLVDPSEMDISIAFADKDREDYLKRVTLVKKILQTRVQEHLAGLIQITSGNRTGYILIDPGYSNGEKLVQPFVVFLMEDGKYPHKEFVNGFSSPDQIQFTVKLDIPFILAKHTYSDIETKVLYYMKPYCSFIENTIKMNLLRLNHGIIVRDSKNKKQMYLTFKISPQDKSLIILTKIDNITTGKMKVKFDKEKMSFTNSTGPIDEPITLPPFLMELGVSTEEATSITEELKYIMTKVFEDNIFMSKLIDLNKVPQYIPKDPREVREQPQSFADKTQKNLSQRIMGGVMKYLH